MEKLFLEVFPTLKLEDDITNMLEGVSVWKVTGSQDKSRMTVYINSSHLILKKDIRKIEKELEKQLFPGGKVSFHIVENYSLSSLYTPKALMEEYRDSICLELSDYNHVLHRLFYRSQITFPDDHTIVLSMEDTVISRSYEEELYSILEKVFNERCHLNAKFTFEYVEAKKSKLLEMSELRLMHETDVIRKRAGLGASYGQEVLATDKDEEFLDYNDSADTFGEAAGAANGSLQPTGAANKKSETSKKEDTTNEAASSNLVTSANEKPAKGGFKKDGGRGDGFKKRDQYFGKVKKSDDPDVLYGRDFAADEEVITIDQILGEIGEVVIRGKISAYEERETRAGSFILSFNITDFTDTIKVKFFLRGDQMEEFRGTLKDGMFLKVKGMTVFDRYDHELAIQSIVGIRKIQSFVITREDNHPEKRVELHCHTKMSDMDAVGSTESLIDRAKAWGHKALAITDHGVVQAFTEASHHISLSDPFKVIYGVEGYLVDDEKQIVTGSKGQTREDTFVVFDIETTGFSSVSDRIIEIGAAKVVNGEIVDSFSEFVNPGRPIPFRIEQLTGINDNMVKDADPIEEVLPRFLAFVGDAALVAHNAGFDTGFIHENAQRLGMDREYTVVDTVDMSRLLVTELNKSFKLDSVCKALGISLENHHRAIDDATATAHIFIKLLDRMEKEGIHNLDELNEKSVLSPTMIRKMRSFHVIILAKNETGRINLYRLVSESHLKYFSRVPRIPKTLLNQYREGLIVGSACEAGELFSAIVSQKSEAEIARIVNFYDYLEIQPVGNNEFMIRKELAADIEELRDYNRRIVELGEKFKKPVCATCDVHFLDPEDEIYRRIIMAGKGFDDADFQPPLYLHTTEEMLDEFSYLGPEKAEEVVITNTNLIADMVDKISPVRPDKCPPVIDRSAETLTEICYSKAVEIYGENIPKPVEERLEKELKSIIGNGFAVMYIIAQKLVWKSNEDGYLVGSRGSVGSSLVAFLAGITEVNSMSPHYYCSKCHFNDFDSPEVIKFSGMAGCDMPDRICPNCGEKLNKDGFDIPFETFLGFEGDKEPDIDLNFSGEYQSKAHKYTEVIFGAGQTYRAGTIGTLADKTAFGYVKKYFEERGVSKRNCEVERISVGCTGVRRTSGQHPGGIIVLPIGEEIYSFTPVQHPANDMTTDIVTTHFDYHSIDHNLLKLDILGHDDPTMIRRLQDLTGVDPVTIPLDDKAVMSLFQSTEALGITPDDIGGCKLGTLGVPEFGTDFAMQMLIDTKPTAFSDLVRIAGLAHGTDVWLGNAQTLIQEGKATISTAICTRDDIMVYLIHMGVDAGLSFKIMENVRKGKVAKKKVKEWDDWKAEMAKHDVPDWYIWSCERIQYMFPKAHAAAYVMMAWRIAWCKINYPLEYYSAFFSIRSKAFSYETMCQGREKLDAHLAALRALEKPTPKDEDSIKDMRLVQEMYARGFEFWPIDINQADSKYFQVIDGKIMPSLSSIDGMGEKAADAVAIAVKDGPFLSKDDFRQRTGVSKTIADLMDSLGLLGDIPESNQLSLFDFSFN